MVPRPFAREKKRPSLRTDQWLRVPVASLLSKWANWGRHCIELSSVSACPCNDNVVASQRDKRLGGHWSVIGCDAVCHFAPSSSQALKCFIKGALHNRLPPSLTGIRPFAATIN